MKKKNKIILGCILLIGFIMDAVIVLNNNSVAFDRAIYDCLLKNDLLTMIMKCITLLGEDFIIITLSVMSLIFIKKKRVAIFIPVSALIISVINSILKVIFRRPRPIGIALINENGFSFPSGHSITALVFYGFIAYLISQSKLSIRKKTILITLLSITIFAIGLSRIYLGVHYATDVMGGFLLGGAFLVAYASFYDNYIFKNEN